ncbi:B12-binding domain-containing radical SAM protein [Paramagnetospirillum kuznetsovii]|nr:radical SAM protein [Paramagnetospirillum kuznetsovii]
MAGFLVRDILDEVDVCMASSKEALAIDVLYRGLWDHPGDEALLRRLGGLCVRLERWQEAHNAFGELSRMRPNDPEIAVALATAAEKPAEIASSPIRIGRGKYLQFSVTRCFEDADLPRSVLWEVLGDMLCDEDGLAIYGHGPFLDELLAHNPMLLDATLVQIVDDPAEDGPRGLPVVTLDQLPPSVRTVFLCGFGMAERMARFYRLPTGLRIVDAGLLASGPLAAKLAYAWKPTERHAYPLDIPDVVVQPDLDVLIVDCPGRVLAMLPNGIGYVAAALARTALRVQVLDLDLTSYHRYHIRRLFDLCGPIILPDGTEMPREPWMPEYAEWWGNGTATTALEDDIQQAIARIIAARPKILGFSVNSSNRDIAGRIAETVRQACPDIVILAGGYSCQDETLGRLNFPEADYVCIGEADLTVGPLCEALATGQRPIDQPGVMSRFDTPGRRFVPGPRQNNLDLIDFPRYDWVPSLDVYRNYNGYQLTPIIASRGCRWSRCTFCAERFYWRIRSAANFCDELEWLSDHGCKLFMFNESDLNGQPDRLVEICDEIIRRGIKVALTGQLRIHVKGDRPFFDKLAQAGFVALRFGVDAFNDNTLRLQAKGYTMKIVEQNLRACHEAGISTAVNWVIGVPGETDADVEESIANVIRLKDHIDKVENINQLRIKVGSIYWVSPEKYNIRFRRPQQELFEQYLINIPSEEWWSEQPYIDQHVRLERYERTIVGLRDGDVHFGDFAALMIERALHAHEAEADEQTPDRMLMPAHP